MQLSRQNFYLNLVPLILAALACLVSLAFAEDSVKVSKIYVHSKDVFEDAAVHTPIERGVYNFGNWFHINTRESVVRGRLPFGEGSTVSQSEMLEAEKNLRALPYISDAKIEARPDSLGNADLYVETSDHWTFSPAISLGKPGEEWLYAIGLMENNLLGLGHTVGFFFEHLEDRDEKYLLYKSSDFFIPHHKFNLVLSENSDGFSRSLNLGYPFITRSKNQWSYNAGLLWSERTEKYYKSKNSAPIVTIKGFQEDSASLWLLRSFGGASFKTYFGMGYDFHRMENGFWKMDKPNHIMQDSRIGFSIAASRIHLEKKYNLHRVKWAEDIERGYYIGVTVAKNFEELGAENEDLFFEQAINLSAGTKEHNFLARGKNSFYSLDLADVRDARSVLFGEYIFKPSLGWSSVLSAQIDSWRRGEKSFALTAPARQLYLDGNNIFPGFPANYLAGENTFAFKAEQRYFPSFEIFTMIPSFTAFLAAGEATNRLRAFEPRDLLYMAGIGLRVSNSKSVQGVVNHVNLSWPLNGDLKKGFAPRFSFVGKYEL
jgi:hypothetical protein